jgi:hypothetical protein
MIRLRYAVTLGSANQIIEALRKKYGDPATSTQNPNVSGWLSGATWKNSAGYLTVSDAWAPADRPLESYTDITSGLKDSGESKDI